MGISHPLSDELPGGGGGGGVLLLSTPPASCCSAVDFLEHEVSRMDTLAGIAIKYGVQMYARKALLIPLPGRPMPSSVRLNGSGQRSKRAWAPNHQQNRDIADSLDPSNSSMQRSSLAMSSLQSYYGLSSQRSDDSSQVAGSEPLLNSSSPPESIQGTGRTCNSEDATNGGIESDGVTRGKQDGSIRRRQKGEADSPDDLLSDSIKMIRSFLPRPISSIRLSTDAGSPDPASKSSGSFLDGFKSAVRKSTSMPSFADSENSSGVSMWSSSKWAFNHESFTRPLLDGLPKPAPVRGTKAALD
ncbi:unnamed protein product [Alopecurus aequalis]